MSSTYVRLRRAALTSCVILICAAGMEALGSIALGADAVKSTGIYTSAQADEGLDLYEEKCATCHGANLEGDTGPTLMGPGFTSQHPMAGELLKYISQNMPLDTPATLTNSQYLQILAFILRKNGAPAGSISLSFEQALASQTKTGP